MQTKDTNKIVAEEHAALAKTLSKSVVAPLKKIVSINKGEGDVCDEADPLLGRTAR